MPYDRVSVWQKYFGFLLISGTGLVIATTILWSGVRLLGLSPFIANLLGDSVAVTFVFFVSAHRSFVHAHRFMLAKFGAYAGWQVIHIALISWSVESLVGWPAFLSLVEPVAPTEVTAKLLLTPITVTANFVVARFIIEKIHP